MKKMKLGRWRPVAIAGVAFAVWIALWGELGAPAGGDVSFGEAVATFGQGGPEKAKPQAPAPNAKQSANPNANPNAAPPVPEKPPAPTPMSNRVVEYHIGVALDAENRTLNGTETVTWRNPGKQKVQELYFHLYPNAFESDKTTFMKESGGKLRDDERTANSYGSMTITSIETTEGLDLTHRMTFEQPDDGNKADRTLAKLRLPQAVPPNGTVTLKLSFTVKLPEVFARMGYKDDFVMAGQWYPKIAVYEPAGTRGRTAEGWNAHQYHGNSEYYSDFGIFNVKIKVPSDYVVAASGFPPKPAVVDKKSGTKTYHFYADDVHDFAWAASPNFIYAEEPFSAPNVPGVKIKLYLDPSQLELKERYLYAAKKSLERFSEWYGPYPYNTLSIVVPPEGAGGAGGMEYPTLVTAWAADAEKDAGYELERVVVHEIGHQYFYGMVASNEFEEAWLDEGFTSYAEDKLMEAEFGVTPSTTLEASYMTNPASLTRFAWNFDSHDHYADNVYIRGKLVLLAMEKEIGEAKMKRVLRTYFERWKFRHPSTGDFQKTAEDVTKKSWSAFFDQFVYGDLMADYAVERIERTDSDPGTYAYRVTVSSRSGRDGPVPVRFLYEDGQSVRQEWTGDEPTVVFTLPPYAAKLRHVVVDPDYDVVLEHKRVNNFLKTDVDDKLETRWTMGVAKLLEAVFGALVW